MPLSDQSSYGSVIYLDIDGVLNSYSELDTLINMDKRVIRLYGKVDWVYIPMLERLHRIICETNAKVVGISSWFRVGDDMRTQKIANFLDIEIADVIDYTGGGHLRVESVIRHIKENGITNFVVLDDIQLFSQYKEMEDRHVCPARYGLTENLMEKAIYVLCGEQV
ncbi:hypothetical protein phiAS5_ORF0100 [Aeromonas phage phiAS5]|uniref:Uncharacterized protein n=1 Tax=Aeromonas phage phiAS5 TaxID=879630 RepID=E1A2J7_9CAUD|nr:hypothetical protein phiAS5_ORF0100 [Aeromonas phage phiAS5]ADM79943.1 hypothetical protein phiAS5_ORF0100 [Aeromonas phage phiAS5]